MSASCRSCGAPVTWVVTEHGRRMPLDAEAYTGDDPRGLFILRMLGDPPQLTAVAVPPEAFEDERLYRSHFATCPDAADWRRAHNEEGEPDE